MPQFRFPGTFLIEADTEEDAQKQVAAILSAGAVASDQTIQVSAIKVGDCFRSKFPQLDSADDSEIGVNRYVCEDGERWTPGGHAWVVTDVDQAPDSISIVCHETGAWIMPSVEELLDTDQFTRD